MPILIGRMAGIVACLDHISHHETCNSDSPGLSECHVARVEIEPLLLETFATVCCWTRLDDDVESKRVGDFELLSRRNKEFLHAPGDL